MSNFYALQRDPFMRKSIHDHVEYGRWNRLKVWFIEQGWWVLYLFMFSGFAVSFLLYLILDIPAEWICWIGTGSALFSSALFNLSFKNHQHGSTGTHD